MWGVSEEDEGFWQGLVSEVEREGRVGLVLDAVEPAHVSDVLLEQDGVVSGALVDVTSDRPPEQRLPRRRLDADAPVLRRGAAIRAPLCVSSAVRRRDLEVWDASRDDSWNRWTNALWEERGAANARSQALPYILDEQP